MSNRYARQTILPEIGTEGQSALERARILVVGAGGLGSPSLLYLVAAGVGLKGAGGCIGIIDDDTVDVSNLQRQILFCERDEGNSKVDSASSKLIDLNSSCNLAVLDKRLSNSNVLEIFSEFDIIVDGSDNFDTKYLINDAAVKLGLPVIYGSILGFEGQASVFWAEHGPCYRCLYPQPPTTHVPNCAEAGTLGGIAGMIGSIQAVEACKLALGLTHCVSHQLDPLLGRLFLVDARNWETRILDIPKQHDCPVCSISQEDIYLPEPSTLACASSAPSDMTLCDLQGLFESGIPFTVLDVREANEWETGHLEGALHIPLARLLGNPESLDVLNRSEPIVVYCQHGIRSQRAMHHLRDQGYDAFNLLIGWSDFSG